MAGIFFVLAIVFLGFILVKLIGNVIKGILSLIGIVAVLFVILALFASSDYSSLASIGNSTRAYYFWDDEEKISAGYMLNGTQATFLDVDLLEIASKNYKSKNYKGLLGSASRAFILSDKAFNKDTYIISGKRFTRPEVLACIAKRDCDEFDFLNFNEEIGASFVFEKALKVSFGSSEHKFLIMAAFRDAVFPWPNTELFRIIHFI